MGCLCARLEEPRVNSPLSMPRLRKAKSIYIYIYIYMYTHTRTTHTHTPHHAVSPSRALSCSYTHTDDRQGRNVGLLPHGYASCKGVRHSFLFKIKHLQTYTRIHTRQSHLFRAQWKNEYLVKDFEIFTNRVNLHLKCLRISTYRAQHAQQLCLRYVNVHIHVCIYV